MTFIYSGFHAPKIKVSSFSSYSTAKTGRCNTDSKRCHCCCRLSNKFCKCRLFSLHCGGSGNFASQNCHFPWRELRTQCMIPSLGTTACVVSTRHLKRFIHFSTAHSRGQQTDRQAHTPRDIGNNRPASCGLHLVVCVAMQPFWYLSLGRAVDLMHCSITDTVYFWCTHWAWLVLGEVRNWYRSIYRLQCIWTIPCQQHHLNAKINILRH